MESVAPKRPDSDDKTPADGTRGFAVQLARVVHILGAGDEEGLRGDVRRIGGGQLEMFSFFETILRNQEAMKAQFAAHAHADREQRKLDAELHEAERQADATAAKKRCDALAEKIDGLAGKADDKRPGLWLLLASQIVTAGLVVALGALVLFARGCP